MMFAASPGALFAGKPVGFSGNKLLVPGIPVVLGAAVPLEDILNFYTCSRENNFDGP